MFFYNCIKLKLGTEKFYLSFIQQITQSQFLKYQLFSVFPRQQLN